jgi:hypothetical protein
VGDVILASADAQGPRGSRVHARPSSIEEYPSPLEPTYASTVVTMPRGNAVAKGKKGKGKKGK